MSHKAKFFVSLASVGAIATLLAYPGEGNEDLRDDVVYVRLPVAEPSPCSSLLFGCGSIVATSFFGCFWVSCRQSV